MRMQKAIPVFMLAAMFCLVVSCMQTNDARITGTIKSKLAVDSKVSASEINVDTVDGVVTLTGNVDSRKARNRAIELAKETSGVKDVKDMISVRTATGSGDAPESGRTVGEHIDDAGITMRVKARLLDDPGVNGLQIDVDTRDGVVYLTGSIPSDSERKQAIALASTTEGVKDVKPNFTSN